MENKMSKNFADKLQSMMPKDTESVIQTSLATGELDEELKGGVADDITLEELASKHDVSVSHIVNQLSKGIKNKSPFTAFFHCPDKGDHLTVPPSPRRRPRRRDCAPLRMPCGPD